jgi:hypothetical protein
MVSSMKQMTLRGVFCDAHAEGAGIMRELIFTSTVKGENKVLRLSPVMFQIESTGL